jgi:hypothetical protein
LNFSRNVLRGFQCALCFTCHLEVGGAIPLWFIYQGIICGCVRYGCLATDGNWKCSAATTLLGVEDLDFSLWHTRLVTCGTKEMVTVSKVFKMKCNLPVKLGIVPCEMWGSCSGVLLMILAFCDVILCLLVSIFLCFEGSLILHTLRNYWSSDAINGG